VTTFITEFYDDGDISGQDTRGLLGATKAPVVYSKNINANASKNEEKTPVRQGQSYTQTYAMNPTIEYV